MLYLANHQLFAEDYLQEIRAAKIANDIPDAARQTMREWQDEYPRLERINDLTSYVSQCLSAMEFSYSIQQDPNRFVLFADETHTRPLGLCLVVTDDQIGRMTKGRHHQVRLIQLLRTNHLKWGIITNGKDWRLCNAGAAAPYEVYLDANLEGMLDPRLLNEFILFYRFFGREAFDFCDAKPPLPAIQKLDEMLAESETRTQAIERHLKDRVEDVLRDLCLGFVADQDKNRLERADLDEIYRNAIYLLYRMLFLFYAEARRLLPVGHPRYQAISLASIIEAAKNQGGSNEQDTYSLWKRLTHLCVVVDDGDESAGVRPYNGGLFSDREKPYLQKHRIADEFLSRVLLALAYMDIRGGFRQIDYRDLSVRHLGTLYEGMLEYRLNLVTDEPVVVRISKDKRTYILQSAAGPIKKGEPILEIGQVYFADDKGERKASGSYYTPEDVVQYIVENTLKPKMVERAAPICALLVEAQQNLAVAVTESERAATQSYTDRKALELVEKGLLGLKILDPAMGSAHFLVAAGQMLTDFIVETLNSLDWPSDAISTDPLLWKRRVVERCLYGVDINPLAQELAKLSLWLTSASEGKPLTFLDHHLKIGNSLYGAPLAWLATMPMKDKLMGGKAEEAPINGVVSASTNTDMFQNAFQNTIKAMIEELAQITTSDSDQIEDVKHKGAVYEAAQSTAARLRDLANVWLASLFGIQGDDGKPLSAEEYFQILQETVRKYSDEDLETYAPVHPVVLEARCIADRERFFHWNLEFPNTYGANLGFDVIIANPPYVGISPNQVVTSLYHTAQCGDLYGWILECSLNQIGNTGSIGFVVPLSFMFAKSFLPLRKLIMGGSFHAELSSYDNVPDGIFNGGKISDNTSTENMQRATIIIARKMDKETIIKTTDLLRWWHQERAVLFKSLRYSNTTSICSAQNFPKIGTNELAKFWQKMKLSKRKLSELALEILSESRRPAPSTICLTVPRAAGYFISATPGIMARNKILSLTFDSVEDMDLARVLINSNVFFWYWRSFGDGFLLGVDILGNFPIPDKVDSDYKILAQKLDKITDECTTFKMYRGEKIPSYNFNKRMDVLFDIDRWIIDKVDKEFPLPIEVFSQLKSNSFLRPFSYELDGAAID